MPWLFSNKCLCLFFFLLFNSFIEFTDTPKLCLNQNWIYFRNGRLFWRKCFASEMEQTKILLKIDMMPSKFIESNGSGIRIVFGKTGANNGKNAANPSHLNWNFNRWRFQAPVKLSIKKVIQYIMYTVFNLITNDVYLW